MTLLQPRALMRLVILAFLGLIFQAAAQAQTIRKINQQELVALLSDESDTLHVVNFWATWCKPCIKEMPHFQQLQADNRNSNLSVTFVCLDFPQDVDKRLKPFLARNKMKGPVLLLDAGNENEWLDLVDPAWSGAIPATIFYNRVRGVYELVERELSLDELQKIVSRYHPVKP